MELNEEAFRRNISFSKYLGQYLEQAKTYQTKLTDLEALLFKEREIAKNTIGNFILEITEGDKKETNRLITIYNSILKNEKSK